METKTTYRCMNKSCNKILKRKTQKGYDKFPFCNLLCEGVYSSTQTEEFQNWIEDIVRSE